MKPPPESLNHRPSILAIHQGAGVSKKQKRGRNQSSKAKKRTERNQDRAIAIIERTESKIAKSKGSSRVIQARSKNWEDINKLIPKDKADGESDDDNDESETNVTDTNGKAPQLDEEMDQAGTQPLPVADNDDDIL